MYHQGAEGAITFQSMLHHSNPPICWKHQYRAMIGGQNLAVRRENLLYETWARINLQLSRDADEVTGCDGFNGLQLKGRYRSEGVYFRTNKPELNHYKKSH